MNNEAVRNTTKCQFGRKCRNEDPHHPRCIVVDASDENVLFVNGDNAFNCPFRVVFGQADVCTCPTNYAFYTKTRHHGRSTPMLHRGEHAESVDDMMGSQTRPATVEEAVQILMDELPLRDKVAIANAPEEGIGELTIDLVRHVRNAFGLQSGNRALWRSCSRSCGGEIEHPDDVSAVILARLVVVLAKTYKLRST